MCGLLLLFEEGGEVSRSGGTLAANVFASAHAGRENRVEPTASQRQLVAVELPVREARRVR